MTENKTFCVLPFIHKHKRLSGFDTLCCYSQYPVGDVGKVRDRLLNGEKVPHCNTCYNYENNGIVSHRIKQNKRWLADPEIKKYIDSYTPSRKEVVYSYDLRYSNTCNLACIGCIPQQSSLWAKELNVHIDPIKLEFDLEDISKAKFVYLAGGEPFLTTELVKLLKTISELEVQPEICISTNLTVQDDEVKKICEKLKSLTIQISIDGTKKVAEYHRWPINWGKFYSNLEWAKSLNCNLRFNTVIDAVNISFVHELLEFDDYVTSWGLSMLLMPPALRIENLPDRHKQFAYNNFIQLKKSKHYHTDDMFKTNLDSMADKILKSGTPKILSDFIQTLDSRRNINHIDYLGLDLT